MNKWKYKNNTDNPIFWRGRIVQPQEEIQTPYQISDSLGLTCITTGDTPDPVLFHDDFVIPAGQEKIFSLKYPAISRYIVLNIECLSANSGVECRFNSSTHNPIPIDARSFNHVMTWETCSTIFLNNPTSSVAHVSVSAIEVMR